MMINNIGNLVLLSEKRHTVTLDIVYASSNNFTGKPVYKSNLCYLHTDALTCLLKAVELLKPLNLRLKIRDAFRPLLAQKTLFKHMPDSDYVGNPESDLCPHCRGVAIDLTITDHFGRELEMGSMFDDFRPLAHHGNDLVSEEAQRNRLLLAGVMNIAGFKPLRTKWWHYQLPNPDSYPLIPEEETPEGII
ncbi:D-alanyl-D-alanine dipeptidase [Endozoicomonas sp. SCSIO W0465]|uniref:D-alanyl-D-alanine dipeptidase n=1 Tax=Endozoicomonas sp. SCSIO W0465 TaxID=2918516 RepID=UPI002074ECFF|nr:D-alanyl-D-alanine dipeptidase [Endozoicomonas sp. SCSIO W0465]USE34432.1 D-alanyl-D-alanine dipeptidase [Endozoicomonas sp. SCSIO W0465]